MVYAAADTLNKSAAGTLAWMVRSDEFEVSGRELVAHWTVCRPGLDRSAHDLIEVFRGHMLRLVMKMEKVRHTSFL